ncbi:MAG: methylenetetrahydrofolate reductase [Sphaerochaetaceae bacterium]|nr:methylenetetrahydrofolate reductase [Sphaerochaetaceae bacterium]
MKVTDIIAQAKRPLFTFELLPPLKGHTLDGIFAAVDKLRGFEPSYINVTNHQQELVYVDRPDGFVERRTVRKRPGTVALSAALQYRFNIPVVPHLICGGMNAEELENTLVELNFLGLDNVFALRGDPPKGERRFVACPGGWEHSDALVRQIKALNAGRYLDPEIKEPVRTDFCVGVAGYPEKHAEAPNFAVDIANLKKKVEAGADYIVTQMFFINDHYYRFVQACRDAGITVPIIPGIKPLGRRNDLELLPQTFHIDLPDALVGAVSKASSLAEIREAGIWWCTEQAKDLLAHGAPGIHFYTLGKSDAVAQVVRSAF